MSIESERKSESKRERGGERYIDRKRVRERGIDRMIERERERRNTCRAVSYKCKNSFYSGDKVGRRV